jgi:large subunit ribosomal protein L27e
VAGIDRYPRKITRGMTEKKVAKRSLMKPFIKAINFSHIMPTRYQVIN